MSINADELVVLAYLKTKLEEKIAQDLVLLDTPEFDGLTAKEQREATTFSKCQVVYGDTEFNLIDSSNNSTPVILPEIDTRRTTTSSNQGSRIYGTSHFTFSVMVARENRSYEVYTQEVINVVNKVEEVFKAETGKRILIGDISFAIFNWNELKVSGAVIPITTNVNNYDYQVT